MTGAEEAPWLPAASEEAAVEEAKEEAIQSATTAFGIDQYEELYQDLYAYAQDSMDFMVSVIGISEMQDWLQGTFENENTTAGLILCVIMLSFNLFADGLRDAFDPKMKE